MQKKDIRKSDALKAEQETKKKKKKIKKEKK